LTPQTVPQALQLLSSLWVLTHVPVQQVPPVTEAQGVPLVSGSHVPFLHRFLPLCFLHLPLLHCWQSLQAGLHLPELAASVSTGR